MHSPKIASDNAFGTFSSVSLSAKRVRSFPSAPEKTRTRYSAPVEGRYGKREENRCEIDNVVSSQKIVGEMKQMSTTTVQ